MKSIMDDMLTEDKIRIFVCVAIIVSSIILVHLTLSYDDYFSAYDEHYIKSSATILFAFGFVYFVWYGVDVEAKRRNVIMSLGTLAVCSTIFVMVLVLTPSPPYFEECSMLTYEIGFVSRDECIEYARYNPDATSAQIIDALTEKNRKVPSIEDLRGRPLNP